MRPICTRARSTFRASRNFLSTARWFLLGCMSIKSMTTKPPKSRKRNCRAISSAASRLLLRAVSSMLRPFVALAELTSIEVNASV